MSRASIGSRIQRRNGRRVPAPITAGAVGVVTIGLVLAGLQSAAHAAPEKVLQSVDVDLGSDGSVDAISSTSIRQGGDGETKDDETTHDPSKVGGDLPIRILTSYRVGDRSGTDLDDLEGVKGRVHIDVTVQNTTVRPSLLTYDSEARSRTAPALVGTPLTVVASADLGETPLSQVVSADADAGDESDATNGIVSLDPDGNARVQWATMLAPPRLATSATFTLVQDVEDFTAPDFDVSVQPGLVTDTSVSHLINSVFEDDNGTQQLTSRTIALLGSVGSVLTDATTVLAKVEEQLDGSASELGTKTIADLTSSSSNVTSALGGLAGDLDSLESTMQRSLDTSRDRAVQQLASSFTQVKDKVLGDPDELEAPTPPEPSPGGCIVPELDDASASTVLGQLQVVEAQLTQLSGATAGCKDEIVTGLKASIGTLTDSCSADTALGSLTCATEALGSTTQDLAAVQVDVNNTFDDTLLAKTRTALDTVLTGLDRAKGRADTLGSGNVGDDSIEELQDDLDEVKTSLTTVDTQLATINARATTQLDLLGGDDGAIEQADALADILCAQLPDGAERDEAITLLKGTDCGLDATVGETTSLRGKIADSVEAWQLVRDETATSGTGSPLGALVDGLLQDVDDLLGSLQDIIAGGGSYESRVARLVEEITTLYAPIPVPPVDGEPQPDQPAPVVQLGTSFDAFEANQSDVGGTLTGAFDRAADAVSDGTAEIGRSRTDVDAARAQSETGAGGLFTEFSQSLAGVGATIVDDGATAVARQRDRLDAERDDFASRVDGTVTKSLRTIGSQVGSANRDLDSSEKQLVADLEAVLVNIGRPRTNGSGLLGAIYTGARRTGASTSKLTTAGDLSDAFSRVRGASLDDLYLQQAQVTASLEKEASFPTFDLDVPAGSRTRTVFSFHLGQD